MTFPFTKYSGCGNDFIIVDNRASIFPKEDPNLVRRLCQRRLGIGADGLILLENSSSADYRMVIFNADGSEAEMCGNGLRCLAHFADPGRPFTIETMHATYPVECLGDAVNVQMTEISPVKQSGTLHFVNTGVPHVVIFVDDLENISMEKAQEIRLETNANVNFAQICETEIAYRTYERGVEGETLACGTGAVAVALATGKEGPLQLRTRSGDPLTIVLSGGVLMRGPAKKVFTGEVTLLLNGSPCFR